MGFIKEEYSNNRVGLLVSFQYNENTSFFCKSDSITEAMNYFQIYEKNGQLYQRTGTESVMVDLDIDPSEVAQYKDVVIDLIKHLNKEEAVKKTILFPTWKENKEYNVGDKVRYDNVLYKVIQAHTSQTDWTPNIAVSFFARVLSGSEFGTILDWVQPTSTEGYFQDDKVKYNGKYYISTMDNNVWEPTTLNAPWEEYLPEWVEGKIYDLNDKIKFNDVIYVSLINNNSSIPGSIEEYWSTEISAEEWVSGNAYMIGDKVLYENQTYSSLIDNNVWSPNDYPAGWELVI